MSPKKKQKIDHSTEASSNKPKCKYWGKCFRTNAAHLAQFLHPVDEDNTKHETSKVAKNIMTVGETVDVKGRYRIKYTGGNLYYCTCPGWKLQKGAISARTCKHLKEHLGEEFERHRIQQQTGKASAAASATTSSKTPTAGTSNKTTTTAVKNLNARRPRSKQIPQLLLANKFPESNDPTGWWMSEKLDGVRAYWDGKSFYSRLGNEFVAPTWFMRGLPSDTELDGELFGGRKQFQSTVSIVKSPESDDWNKLKYYVFDAPGKGSQPFEKRMEYLDTYFSKNEAAEYVTVVAQSRCTGQRHLSAELDRVQRAGGEGLMLRRANSHYENCRSNTLLKVKTFYDAEAVVVGHEPGKGRNSHRMGALRCRMECGKLFSVGTGFTDAQRNKPAKIGTVIVYKFQELTNSGVPRFPVFVGEAADKTEAKDAELPQVEVE